MLLLENLLKKSFTLTESKIKAKQNIVPKIYRTSLGIIYSVRERGPKKLFWEIPCYLIA
jgi:hypothetical protein